MRASKKRVFPLILLFVFLFSLFGFYLFGSKENESHTLYLTLRRARCDNALALRLTDGEYTGTLDGTPCKILSVRCEPSVCYAYENGESRRYTSCLFSDVTLTLTLEGSVRNGMPYADGTFLSLGKRVHLSSAAFYGECEIISLKVG